MYRITLSVVRATVCILWSQNGHKDLLKVLVNKASCFSSRVKQVK